MEINDPTHLTGHVCVDGSRDKEKYQGFALSGCPEDDRRGDRHLSGTRQRLCVDIYHVIYYVMNLQRSISCNLLCHESTLYHVIYYVMNAISCNLLCHESATLVILSLDTSCIVLKLSPRLPGFAVANHFFIRKTKSHKKKSLSAGGPLPGEINPGGDPCHWK